MTAALPYIAPFALFILILALQSVVAMPQWVRFAVPMIAILTVSRRVLSFKLVRPVASVLVGIAVFVIWVGPEMLFPGYHQFGLFSNSVMGHINNVRPANHADPLFLTFRILVTAVAVPILEELFWRGWLMRWLIDRDFERVPLGAYNTQAFLIVAVLFASEHGPFWDVGLVTGLIFNWWMVRTKSLWDCILMHAVTNAFLAWYVLAYGQWQYWL